MATKRILKSKNRKYKEGGIPKTIEEFEKNVYKYLPLEWRDMSVAEAWASFKELPINEQKKFPEGWKPSGEILPVPNQTEDQPLKDLTLVKNRRPNQKEFEEYIYPILIGTYDNKTNRRYDNKWDKYYSKEEAWRLFQELPVNEQIKLNEETYADLSKRNHTTFDVLVRESDRRKQKPGRPVQFWEEPYITGLEEDGNTYYYDPIDLYDSFANLGELPKNPDGTFITRDEWYKLPSEKRDEWAKSVGERSNKLYNSLEPRSAYVYTQPTAESEFRRTGTPSLQERLGVKERRWGDFSQETETPVYDENSRTLEEAYLDRYRKQIDNPNRQKVSIDYDFQDLYDQMYTPQNNRNGGRILKSKVKKMQPGGQAVYDQRVSDVRNSTRDYVASQEYLDRLRNFMTEEEALATQKERLRLFDNTKMYFSDNPADKRGYFAAPSDRKYETKMATRTPDGVAVMPYTQVNWGYGGKGSALSHELAHASQSSVGNYTKAPFTEGEVNQINSSIKKAGETSFNEKDYKYIASPEEYHARMYSLRRLANDLGIHKNFGEQFTNEQLNQIKEQLKKSDTLLNDYRDVNELLEISNSDDNLVRNLNTIAAVNNKQDMAGNKIVNAKQGGKVLRSRVKKMQPGGPAENQYPYLNFTPTFPDKFYPKEELPGYGGVFLTPKLSRLGKKWSEDYIYREGSDKRPYYEIYNKKREEYYKNNPSGNYDESGRPNYADKKYIDKTHESHRDIKSYSEDNPNMAKKFAESMRLGEEKSAEDIVSYMNYIASDDYLKRLMIDLPEEEAKKVQADALRNLQDVSIESYRGDNLYSIDGVFDRANPFHPNITLYPRNPYYPISTFTHELAHSSRSDRDKIDNTIGGISQDYFSKREKNQIKSSLKPIDEIDSKFIKNNYKYFTDPGEYHARMNSARRMAYDLGIHKKFGEEFTQEQLDEIKKLRGTEQGKLYDDVYELLDISKDDNTVIKNLNTIAYEDAQPKSDIPYAMQGGRILRSKSSIPPVPKPAVMQAKGGGFFSKLGNTVKDFGLGLADSFGNMTGFYDINNSKYNTTFGRSVAGGVDKYSKAIGSVNRAIANVVLPGSGTAMSAIGKAVNPQGTAPANQMPSMASASPAMSTGMSSFFSNPNNISMLTGLAGSLLGGGGNQNSFMPMLGGFGMAKDGGRILSKRYSDDLEDDDRYEPRDYDYDLPEEMADGGIPQRYRNLGFNKVGQKRKSNRPGKKWMVLAKKGDQYKIVHGGALGMSDFTKHKNEKRRDRFWDRMGGKDSAKANDPFSPLYWHKRFRTW